MKNILLSILILTYISSCKVIKSMSEMKKQNAKIYSYNFIDKEIKYIPMHHLGKKEFYDDVKSKILNFKKDSFIIYYEQISSKLNIDTIQNDEIRRKVRKIKGFNGSYADVSKGTVFKKYVPQPPYSELGITKNDKRADINYLQFINEWEKINGKIQLDSVDKNTPLDSKYEKGTFYTNAQYKKIVVEYRNQFLVDLIKTNTDKKILIIYGEGHRKDFENKIKSTR